MRYLSLTLTAFAALSLAACSPAPNTSDAASDSESAAATVAAVPVETADSVSSSAASVVVKTTEIYDAATIEKLAAKPGYWQIAHVDPDTHKRYLTKVCVDQDLGRRMATEHPQPPAGWRGGTPDASFLGKCPAGAHGGDVIDRNGGTHNAWGDHRDDHGTPGSGPHTPPDTRDGDNGHDGHDNRPGDHHDSSSTGNDGHHFPPGDGGAAGRPDSHIGQGSGQSSGQGSGQGSSSSHDRHDRSPHP